MSSGKAERGEFMTSLLAHDISNYNQTSRGYLEMLLDEQMGPLTDDQARALTICLRQSARIQSLLESARVIVELSSNAPQVEPRDLDQAIQSAIQQTQATYADREIRVRFAPGGRQVMAEPQIELLFRHLLSNAVRHNDLEVVEVSVDAERTEEGQGGFWKVLIRDNGEGIPPARQQDLFDRLETLAVHGSGLGLSVVKFLITRWGGRVWLEPPAGGPGAVFGLMLPAA